MIYIEPIKAFSDNYIWCLSNDAGQAFVVDPGDAAPVEAHLSAKGLNLAGVLITHHHPDHVGGLGALTAQRDIPVYGPAGSAPQINQSLTEGSHVQVLCTVFTVMAVPGHTLDHIAYFTDEQAPGLLFCGDTLFAGGCGRLFEGTPEQMHESLAKLKNLPLTTKVYCAHEYTMANLRFAQAVEPNNEELVKRVLRDNGLLEQNLPTVPSTIADELATNPFLRADQPAVRDSAEEYGSISPSNEIETFATIRRWKDNF